jgi:hypothetical protein
MLTLFTVLKTIITDSASHGVAKDSSNAIATYAASVGRANLPQ